MNYKQSNKIHVQRTQNNELDRKSISYTYVKSFVDYKLRKIRMKSFVVNSRVDRLTV